MTPFLWGLINPSKRVLGWSIHEEKRKEKKRANIGGTDNNSRLLNDPFMPFPPRWAANQEEGKEESR